MFDKSLAFMLSSKSPVSTPPPQQLLDEVRENYGWPLAVALTIFVCGGLWTLLRRRTVRTRLGRIVAWPFSLRIVTRTTLAAREQAGWDRRQAELDQLEFIPPPEPRWRVQSAGSSKGVGSFQLINAATDAFAKQVELDADSDEFSFLDSARFADLSDGAVGDFKGRIEMGGRFLGVSFRVSWTDAAHRRRSRDIFMASTVSGPAWTV